MFKFCRIIALAGLGRVHNSVESPCSWCGRSALHLLHADTFRFRLGFMDHGCLSGLQLLPLAAS